MALLDSGGASMRRRHDRSGNLPEFVLPLQKTKVQEPKKETTVRFSVAETHDGEPCDCIDAQAKEMTLRVGDQVILTHVCHDGRVDKVTATILGVDVPKASVEHGGASSAARQQV